MAQARKPPAEAIKEALRDIQHDVLEATATGGSARAIMELLCRRVEALDTGAICTVLSVDPGGRLHTLAAPSLPVSYAAAIDGVSIGPNVGSCGTAAYRGEPVIVTDIAADPLWREFKDLALSIGLHACWSSPIKARDGRVIGTFAFYKNETGGPSPFELEAVTTCTHLCAIALEHKEARERIHHIAYFDQATGLPNRARYHEILCEALRAPGERGLLAVHLVDIDDFRALNDTLGHAVGDQLLVEVAARLRAVVADEDVVARVGGDEFAVLQRRPAGEDGVRALAERLVSAFTAPFALQLHTVAVTASLGVAMAEETGGDLARIDREVDMALLRAKSEGGDTYRMFDPQMLSSLLVRRTIEQDLRAADFERDFEVHYQPIVAFPALQIVAAEALLRWKHPKKGYVSPATFIPVAEQSGLMVKLGERVLEQVCRDAARWRPDIRVGVNLSPVQLKRHGFASDVLSILASADLPAERLVVEITETALLGDAAAARAILGRFSAEGIAIALDDFGTGYSSLSHLRAFPIDVIKIDKCFIGEYGAVHESTAIVDAVLSLARELGMVTVAEGVETAEQLAHLERSGCARAQGYHLGRPQPRGAFEDLLARSEPRPLAIAQRPLRASAPTMR